MITETGSHLEPMDSGMTQLKAQGPSRTCNESKEEEEEGTVRGGEVDEEVAELEVHRAVVRERVVY